MYHYKLILKGIMPKVNISITNSSYDVIDALVTLSLNLPLTFPILFGNTNATVMYNESIIGIISLPHLTSVYPGSNNISAMVELTAQYSRRSLENFVSSYLFGGYSDLTLLITMDSEGFIGALNMQYDFRLPNSSGMIHNPIGIYFIQEETTLR